jgi:hypothetical protein
MNILSNKYIQLGITGLLVILFIAVMQQMKYSSQDRQNQAIPKEEEKPQNEINSVKRTEFLKEIEDFTAGIDFDSSRANKLIKKAIQYQLDSLKSDSLAWKKLNSFRNICTHIAGAKSKLRQNKVPTGETGTIEGLTWIIKSGNKTYTLNETQKAEIQLFIDVMTAVKSGVKLKGVQGIEGQSRERRKEVGKFLTRQKLRVN